jgi:hypothetical protein
VCAATSNWLELVAIRPDSSSFEKSPSLIEPRPTSTNAPITRRTIFHRKCDAPILNSSRSPSVRNRMSVTTTTVERSSARLSQKWAKS